MAKIKFGSIVTDGRNKIGGHVLSKNRHGNYIRTKVSPSQPASAYSAASRSRLSSISASFKALDPEDIAAWNAAVVNWKVTDIFGDLRTPSGFNLYQKLNNNLVNIGESMIDVPPVPAAVDILTIVSLTAVAATKVVTLTLGAAIPATSKAKIFATAQRSPSRALVSSDLRQIKIGVNGDTATIVLTTAYDAKYSEDLVAGNVLSVAIEAVNATTGQAGRKLIVSCVIS